MIRDYFSIALRNITHRKIRSWLTILGVIVGVAAVIALLAASQGLNNSVKKQFESFGSNKIFVMGGQGLDFSGNIVSMTKDDVEVIDKVGGVKWVLSYTMHSANVEYGREKKFARHIIAIPTDGITDKYDDFMYKLDKGRLFEDGEKTGVLVGPSFAKDFFDKEVKPGNQLIIKGKKVTVIGIYQPIGNTEDDNAIVMPQALAEEIYGKSDDVSIIEVRVKQGVDINSVAGDIKQKLKRARGDDNFEVMTPEQLLKSVEVIMSVIQAVLIGVAAISLIVGSIGIMNSMFTNVLERTKEIGILKAVGATNFDIMMIFVFEAGIIGLIGGVIGIVLGVIIAKIIEGYASVIGFTALQIDISVWLIIFGIVFSIAIGVLSGFMPARRASRLQPVEALRGAK